MWDLTLLQIGSMQQDNTHIDLVFSSLSPSHFFSSLLRIGGLLIILPLHTNLLSGRTFVR